MLESGVLVDPLLQRKYPPLDEETAAAAGGTARRSQGSQVIQESKGLKTIANKLMYITNDTQNFLFYRLQCLDTQLYVSTKRRGDKMW